MLSSFSQSNQTAPNAAGAIQGERAAQTSPVFTCEVGRSSAEEGPQGAVDRSGGWEQPKECILMGLGRLGVASCASENRPGLPGSAVARTSSTRSDFRQRLPDWVECQSRLTRSCSQSCSTSLTFAIGLSNMTLQGEFLKKPKPLRCGVVCRDLLSAMAGLLKDSADQISLSRLWSKILQGAGTLSRTMDTADGHRCGPTVDSDSRPVLAGSVPLRRRLFRNQ